MCKGLAICVNKDGTVLCRGVSSHEETKKDVKDPEEWLDFECIWPKWDEPVLDKDGASFGIWKEKGLLTLRNEPKKKLVDAVVAWLHEHELQVYRWFLTSPNLMAYATIGGNQDHSAQTIEGNQDHRCQTIKGNQDHSAQTIEGNQDHRCQTIEGDQNHQGQTIEGNQYHSYQTIKGNQDHQGQTIEGDQDHSYQIIGGNQNHQGQTIGGKIYIHCLKQGEADLQAALDEFHRTKQTEYTWGSFYRWVVNREQKKKE